MDFNIAPTPNGARTLITRSDATLGVWANRSGTFTYTGTSGVQTLGFEAISGKTYGNFLDNIQVSLTPYLEFFPGAASGLENIATSALPNMRVSGTLTTPTVVQITVTGGTATLGTDYTTPSGTASFNVTIPQGDYDGTQAIPLGIVILNDTDIEPDETITLAITPNPASYTIASTQSCGAAANASGTYTIIDDDARIRVNKALTGPRVAPSDQFALQIAGANGPVAVNTTGAGSTATGQAGLSNIAVGTSYTLSEAMAAGSASPQSRYAPSLSCTNAKAGSTTVLPGGAVRSATVTPKAGDDITCVFTNTPRNPAITVTKAAGAIIDVNANGMQDAGDRVPYTFTATNTGDVMLTGVRINDAKLDATALCSPTTLAPGATANCTGVHTVTQAEVTAGSVVNTATATGSPPEGGADVTSPPVSVTVPLVAAPKLTVVKSAGNIVDSNASGRQDAGDRITYTFTVKNTGNVPLTGVNVDDARIGITDLAVSPATLAPGATGTASVTYALLQSDVDAGVITNSATASGTPPTGGEVTSPPSTTTTPITGASSIVLTKTAGAINDLDANGPDVGDTIAYTFTVRNTGTVTLDPVTVADPLLGGAIACPVAPLAAGASASCGTTATYTLTQADIDAGQFTNTATATGTPPSGPPVTGNSSTTTPIVQTRRLTVVKTAGLADTVVANGMADAGEVITYGVSVQNTGNVTVTNLSVSDSLDGAPPTTLACLPLTLLPGETATCASYTHTVSQGEIDQQAQLRNVATATGNTPVGPVTGTDTKIVPPTRRLPAVAIDKTVDKATISAPGILNYTIVVRNAGNVTLTGVNVTDTLPDGNPATLPAPTESLVANGMLEVGETWTYAYAHQVDQAAIDNAAGPLRNVASVTTAQTPPATDRADTQVARNASFSTIKTVDKATISAPGQLNYTIKLVNTGNVSLTNVTPVDTLPNGDTAVLPLPVESVATNGVLEVGETWTYTFSYDVDQAAIEAGGTLVNTVSVTTSQTPSPQGSATTTIAQFHALSVGKTVDKGSITGPGTLNYTITVRNIGNVALSNIVAVDTMPDSTVVSPTFVGGDANGDGKLDVGETWTYSATYTVGQAEFDAGLKRDNTVSVTSAETPTPVTDTATTILLQSPAMTVAKTVDRPAIAAPGTLNYTITLRNTGNVSLTSVTPVDTLPDATAGVLAGPVSSGNADNVLDVGETWTYTISYAVGQPEIDAGADRVNGVTVMASPPSGPAITGSSSATTTIAVTPRLMVEKLVDLTSISGPQTLAYTIRVHNAGNVTLTGIALDDTLPDNSIGTPVYTGGDTNGDNNLDVSETWIYTASYAVGQTEIDAGAARVNSVTVSSDQVPPETATATTTIQQAASMAVKKTVDKGSINTTGALNYTITVQNTGNVSLSNVTPVDTLPDITPGTLSAPTGDDGNGVLDPGETWTYLVSYAVDQAEIDAGTSLVNTVGVTATPPSGPDLSGTSSATTLIVSAPSFTVEKRVDRTSISDPQTLTYTIAVRNTGNVSLTGANVADTLAPGARPINVGAPSESAAPANGVIDVGETWTYTATFAATQADIDAGADLVNTVAVTTTQSPAVQTATATTVIAQAPAMLVKKTVDLQSIAGPATLSYTITVRNTGNVSLTNVTPTDTLPSGGAGVLTGPIFGAGDNGDNVLDRGETWTYQASYAVSQAEIDAGTDRVNTVSVTSDQTPPVTDTATTTIVQAPGLALTKAATAGQNFSAVGQVVTYSYLVRNSGNVSITALSVDDDKIVAPNAVACPALPAGGLAPAQSVTCTANYTVVQADLDRGSVTNTAIATDGTTSSPPATVTVLGVQSKALTLVKNVTGGAPYAAVGDVVTYSYTVTNVGNVTVTDPISVDDNKIAPAAIACPALPAGGLPPTQTLTCNASYTIVQADLNNGSVTNTATATDGGVTTPPATRTVTATQTPSLTVLKTATLVDTNGNGRTDLGDNIVYAFRVENTGNVVLRDVTVADALPDIVFTGGPIATLDPAGVDTATFSATYALKQADLDALQVVNTATATAVPPAGGTVVSGPSTVTTPLPSAPGFALSKTASAIADTNGNGRNDAGDTVTYSFVVTNTGTVTLTGLRIDDARIGMAAIPVTPATLAPNSTGTASATYVLTQADVDSQRVENQATATGTPVGNPGVPVTTISDDPTLPGPFDPTVVPIDNAAALTLKKTAEPLRDTNGDGITGNEGDEITYRYEVTNAGAATLRDVAPLDNGPSFNGRAAAGKLSAFSPASQPVLAPGAAATFTATYVLLPADVDAAAGIADGVKNTAIAEGFASGDRSTGTRILSPASTALIALPTGTPGTLTLVKQAGLRQIRIGEKAPFTILATNNVARTVGPVTITDTIPVGFRFVTGSASVDGVAATPEVAGRNVIFRDINLGANAKVQIRLQMLALSTAGPGRHVNRAVASDARGALLGPEATAWVEIVAEPVFDCGEIVGKVFDDLNGNGYQDDGEPGLPGVRVVTVRGLLITTDEHGRFHVACADMPDKRIGSNFVLKLDERTLPSGYRLTTENPRSVRLTAGKMTKLNFGAQIGHVVRLDLQDAAFEAGSTRLKPRWERGIDRLIDVLAEERSVLRLSYVEPGGDEALARRRVKELEKEIAGRWGAVGGRYRLEIETRVETGR